MAIELVTGAARQAHVSSDDIAHLFAGLFGKDAYVIGGEFPKLTFQGANTLQIQPCDLLVNGRLVRLTGDTSVSIQSGSQLAHRRDFICVRYIADRSSNTESAELVVAAGNAVANSQPLQDPTVPLQGNILDGAPDVYVPIIKIEVDELTPKAEWIVSTAGTQHCVNLFTGDFAQTKSSQITLSDVVTNYTKIDVVYQTTGGDIGTITIYKPQANTKFVVWSAEPSNDYIYFKNKGFLIQPDAKTINAARVTGSSSSWWAQEYRLAYTANAGLYTSHTNNIGIISVYGYKF